MQSKDDDLRKQFNLLRAALYLSFLVALGSTAFLAVSLFPLGYTPAAVPSTAATQTAFANATVATTTTVYSYSSTKSPSGGYSEISPRAWATPNLLTYTGFIAVLSWTVFAGALIWRGHVRSVWGQSRFSYDTFRLLVRMRGAQTRVKLMRSLDSPKNKLQLATALGIDWKAVDKHVHLLEKNGLIHASSTNGTATFYEISEKGKNLMQVLEHLSTDIPP